MKTIGIYNYNSEDFKELEERLKKLDIKLRPLEQNEKDIIIDLYIFNINTLEQLKIEFDRPFAIISSFNDALSIRKSFKMGALDYIHKPFLDLDIVAKRIERILEKLINLEELTFNPIINKFNKIIEVEIKRAHRGNYPLALGNICFEQRLNDEILSKILNKVKLILRESDSCVLYPDGNIYMLLPFTNEDGVIVVVRKIIDLLNEIGHKGYCLCASYPTDGDNKEELMNNLGKNFDSRNIYI